MKFDKILLKNYKCFNETGCIIENIKPVNIIIGKNNAGKSSLIETIKFLTDGNKEYLETKRNGENSEIIFQHIFNKDLIGETFPSNRSGGDIGINHKEYGLSFVGSTFNYTVVENLSKRFLGINKEFQPSAEQYFRSYLGQITSPLQHKIFRHLSAERDIQPEYQNNELNISINGIGATNLIQSITNRDIYNSELIEKTLLEELNKILNPDIEFTRILVQQNANQIWEIYFESKFDGRVPLSKMGSGVKTILLVLILIHIKPTIDNGNISDYVFALEELENNLHPSLQRRLYYYLFDFSQKTGCVLFLTTHSNIVIDLYNSLQDTQIFHIKKTKGITTISSIIKQIEFKKILDDLEVKASDILQSNGIIWVEGPSDRTYVNKWISIIDNTLIEGYHYSIMFYGGRLLSNLTFKFQFIDNELIPLLKLNTNAFVLIDRDGKTVSQKLNNTKLRIQSEIGQENIWITKGREIENYLSNETIENWLSNNYQIQGNFFNALNNKLEESISYVDKLDKLKYNLNKNKFASEIANYIEIKDLKQLDLEFKLNELILNIRKWNKI